MKKTTLWTIIVLVVVILVAGFFFIGIPFHANAPKGSGTLPLSSFSDHTTYYTIDTNYASSTPLNGSADSAAVTLMGQFVGDTIAQFKKDGNFDNLTAEDITMMSGRTETLQITYLIATSPHTISYIYTIYEDTLGAHGNTFFRTFTFDTDTGASLALSDLFTKGSPYLATLSTTARAKLTASLSDSSMTSFIEDGTKPDADNFQNFFLDNKDVVLLFAPYEVAPYAAGPQTVRIPTSELSDVLSATYR